MVAGLTLVFIASLASQVGCRKKERPSVAPGAEPVEKPAQKAVAFVTAEKQAEPVAGKAQADVRKQLEAGPVVEESQEPQLMLPVAVIKEDVASQEFARDERASMPSGDQIPSPAVDRDRLKEVFVDMWCAQLGGAGPDELMRIYHKYDYPPLTNWYDVWNKALTDPVWARTVMAAARAKCWNLVKKQEKNKGLTGMPPAKEKVQQNKNPEGAFVPKEQASSAKKPAEK